MWRIGKALSKKMSMQIKLMDEEVMHVIRTGLVSAEILSSAEVQNSKIHLYRGSRAELKLVIQVEPHADKITNERL